VPWCPRATRCAATSSSGCARATSEDGSFGTTVDTAHALQGFVALGRTDVQAQRAARWLASRVQRTAADELDAWSRPVARGLGLSPAGFDPSAGPREAALALAGYMAAGGR
jgi:hypothetical protein